LSARLASLEDLLDEQPGAGHERVGLEIVGELPLLIREPLPFRLLAELDDLAQIVLIVGGELAVDRVVEIALPWINYIAWINDIAWIDGSRAAFPGRRLRCVVRRQSRREKPHRDCQAHASPRHAMPLNGKGRMSHPSLAP